MESLFGFMGISHWELLIVLGIILLLFGSTRLPSLMRNVGRSAVEFKKGMAGIEDELKEIDKDKPDSSSS